MKCPSSQVPSMCPSTRPSVTLSHQLYLQPRLPSTQPSRQSTDVTQPTIHTISKQTFSSILHHSHLNRQLMSAGLPSSPTAFHLSHQRPSGQPIDINKEFLNASVFLTKSKCKTALRKHPMYIIAYRYLNTTIHISLILIQVAQILFPNPHTHFRKQALATTQFNSSYSSSRICDQ